MQNLSPTTIYKLQGDETVKTHEEVMEHWKKISDIKRWCKFGLITPKEASYLLKKESKEENPEYVNSNTNHKEDEKTVAL